MHVEKVYAPPGEVACAECGREEHHPGELRRISFKQDITSTVILCLTCMGKASRVFGFVPVAGNEVHA